MGFRLFSVRKERLSHHAPVKENYGITPLNEIKTGASLIIRSYVSLSKTLGTPSVTLFLSFSLRFSGKQKQNIVRPCSRLPTVINLQKKIQLNRSHHIKAHRGFNYRLCHRLPTFFASGSLRLRVFGRSFSHDKLRQPFVVPSSARPLLWSASLPSTAAGPNLALQPTRCQLPSAFAQGS